MLRVISKLLGAPAGTKVLVGVDELSKAYRKESGYTPASMLRSVCAELDQEELLHVSIPAYVWK